VRSVVRHSLVTVDGRPRFQYTEQGIQKAFPRGKFSPYESSLLNLWFEKVGRALIHKGGVSCLMGLSTISKTRHFGYALLVG